MSEAISDDDREIQLLEAERLMELGIFERERGRSNEAERCFRQALSTFQFHGNRIGEGRALGSIGLTFYQRGEVKGVEDLYRRSIQILMESGETDLTKQLGNWRTCIVVWVSLIWPSRHLIVRFLWPVTRMI